MGRIIDTLQWVAPIMSLDWMQDLAKWTPIDTLWEFYWIQRYEYNDLTKYLDKGIRDQDIATVDAHFNSIWMPIPWWFKVYRQMILQSKEGVNEWWKSNWTVWTNEDKGTSEQWGLANTNESVWKGKK